MVDKYLKGCAKNCDEKSKKFFKVFHGSGGFHKNTNNSSHIARKSHGQRNFLKKWPLWKMLNFENFIMNYYRSDPYDIPN